MSEENNSEELKMELLRVRIEREKIQLENERLRQSAFKDSRNLLFKIMHLPYLILKVVWQVLSEIVIFVKRKIVYIVAGLFLIFGYFYLSGSPSTTENANRNKSLEPSSADSSPLPVVKAPPTARQGAEPFTACPQFFAGGQSPWVHAQPLQRPLCYEAFAILHNGTTKTPMFVAQRLNRQSLAEAANQQRTNRFFADARLPQAERAELDDYKYSGYSYGHMAAADDMLTSDAMTQSFSLANMIPKFENVNANVDPWVKVEQDTRHYVRRAKGDVYVITGPVYLRSPQTIGDNRVWVPDYVFKLVYDEAANRAWAHWHANHDDTVGGLTISYQELVKRTGIEFLPGLGL